ncbi:MAG: AMP-binding protein [Chlamydiota bacterium]
MKTPILKVVCWLLKGVLSLRYKIQVRGLDALDGKTLSKKGGVLLLPNHPANIDPIILYIYLWPKFQMRPLVVEYIYRQKFTRFLMKMVRALPVPNLETSINELKVKVAEESLEKAIEGLEKKESFLIYPAGRLKKGAKEVIGGASAAHTLLLRVPDTNIVLIRTVGLWGSSFSRALDHKSPDLKKTFWNGFKILLKNGLFFCKRRKVTIDICPNPEEFPYGGSRLECNRFLENWYNQYPSESGEKGPFDEEPLTLVSYAFYKAVYPKIQEKKRIEKSLIGPGLTEKEKETIFREIAHLAKVEKESLHKEMHLALDLGMDSLDIASLASYLADHFEIGDIYPEDIETIEDVLELSAGQKYSSRDEEEEGHCWPQEENRPPVMPPEGKNLIDAYLRICHRMGTHAACADHLSGVLSYKKMQKAVIALALEFRAISTKHVGVLLPASSVAYIVTLALMLAGKVPVMLNWTLGAKFLNDSLKQTHCEVVISSWKFLEKLSHVEFGEMLKKIRYLEDYRKNMSIKTKLETLITSVRSRRSILRKFRLQHVSLDDVAVILFTSGTEALPKGVPLTHGNILINEQSALKSLPVTNDDIVFGVLPTFHSFGLSVTGLFPILSGLKTAFYPDPTDGFALVKGIQRWKATIFAAPPSFLRSVLHLAKNDELASLRLIISGAEKPSQNVLDLVAALKPARHFVQGYGITECSPVVAMNETGKPLIGVGKPISCVSCHTIHPETKQPLPEGTEGEICVSGPSVFSGYLNQVKSPFTEFSGKKWYMTGDLGYIDAEGNIVLSGRLKRFAKIGGEMVSLGAVEEAIRAQFPAGELPAFAASCLEKEGLSVLVLFTTMDLDLHVANGILRSAGFSRLVKIKNIHKLEQIPLTGTGKIDYRKLQDEFLV